MNANKSRTSAPSPQEPRSSPAHPEFLEADAPIEERLRIAQTRLRAAERGFERRTAELTESEERFRQLAENMQEVFWISSLDGRKILYVSPSYEEIWGRTCQDLHANPQDWIEAIHPDDRERVREVFFRDAPEGNFSEVYRIIRPDGSLRCIWDRGVPIHDARGAVYQIAGIAEDITERKSAEERVQAYQSQLRSLASELLLAEERERRKLALDLHDGLGQTLALIRIKVQMLRSRDEGQAVEVKARLNEIDGLVELAHQAARSMTFQLSPPVLHDLGFIPALQWLIEDLQERYGLRVRLDDDGHISFMDKQVRIILFRTVRELLINVAKHAETDAAVLSLRRDGDRLKLAVEDAGTGFQCAETDTGSGHMEGFGLFSIRERVSQLGGNLRVHSVPGQGTRVTVELPVASLESARSRS